MSAEPSRWRWLWYGLGIGMIAWGARGLMMTTSTRQLIHAGRLVVLDVAGHDGLFAPIAFALGLASQRLPHALKAPVRVGLALSGVLVLLAMPLILSDRRGGRNASILPLPYERNLAILIGCVALGVAASVILARVRSRTRAPQP